MNDLAFTPPSGLYFEEMPVGLVVTHPQTRTVTETDNLLFSMLSMNPQPLHVDAEYAAQTEFKKPLVNSLFTLGLVVGLTVRDLTLTTTVANLGFSEVNFPAPVFAGDTIHVETEVTSVRESASRPQQGIVGLEHRGFNQDGVLVCRARRTALMHRRP